MKLSRQMWLVVAIILVGTAAAGLILKTDQPAMEADGHSEHAAEVAGKDEHADHEGEYKVGADTAMPPEHGESGHDHEKDHSPAAQKIQKEDANEHEHAAIMSESVKGPHGGKLFKEGDYAVEVTIFEQDQPPQFRLYTYLNGKILAAKESAIQLKVSRLGREAQIFKLSPENDYLTSKAIVEEPHSFKVAIDASHAGSAYEFSYDQVEARVTLTGEQLKHNAIEVLKAAPADIQTNLRLIGEVKLNADNAVQVLPRIGGVVNNVAANVGDTVKKGQTLAIIASPTLVDNRGDLAAARQRLNLAKTTLVREETLWRDKISAEQDYLAAKNDVQLAEIELSRQQQKLSSMDVAASGNVYALKSPINGVVTRKQVVSGQVIELSQILFEVADLNTVWAEISIPTKDLGVVKVGQSVSVGATAFAQTEAGKITYIAPLIDAQSRTATARVVLNNQKRNWLVGLPVNIDLVADQVNVPLAVSLEAIQSLQYGDVVFGRYGDNFEARPVELGRRDSKHVEVLSGLNAGEQYAAGNSFIVKAELGKAGASHDH